VAHPGAGPALRSSDPIAADFPCDRHGSSRQNPGHAWLCARFWNPFDSEQKRNYVLLSFREDNMIRAVVEEAAALTSLALFLGMIAVWAQVLAAM
jgi:hypothetical protein